LCVNIDNNRLKAAAATADNKAMFYHRLGIYWLFSTPAAALRIPLQLELHFRT